MRNFHKLFYIHLSRPFILSLRGLEQKLLFTYKVIKKYYSDLKYGKINLVFYIKKSL